MTITDGMRSERGAARAVNQLTSNQAVRAVITLALLAVVLWQYIASGTIDDTLVSILGVLLGYYFGEMSPHRQDKTT